MTGERLAIGMIAPIAHDFPPPGYGPWERVCHDLVEGLSDLGHEIVVFAPQGSKTSGRLVETVPTSLATADPADHPDARVWEDHHIAVAMRDSVTMGLDLIHSHLHVHAVGYGPHLPIPLLSTLHGAAWNRANHLVLETHRDQPYVSLSDSERGFLPCLNYVATIGNGIRLDEFTPGPGTNDALVFVGRMSPEKAPDLAVEVARRSGRPLVMAGLVEDQHREFYETRIEPFLDRDIRHVGAIDRGEVAALVGGSAGLLMPLRWDEPFGLVVVESLAVGTPVVAWRRGAMEELIEDGETGFLVDDSDQAVTAVDRLSMLDRGVCRQRAEQRFGHATMAQRYVAVYRHLAGQSMADITSSTSMVATPTPRSENP